MSHDPQAPSSPTFAWRHSPRHSRFTSLSDIDILKSGPLAASEIQPPSRKVNNSVDIGLSRSVRKGSISYKPGESHDVPKHSDTRETRCASPRWLIIVIPTSLLDLDSVNPSASHSDIPKRMSSGILIPLLPTLYLQLVAIAREFGLPSTAGLRTYLRPPDPAYDNRSNSGPQITDSVWPLLWRHFLGSTDEHTILNSTHLLPIAGRIEFDADLRIARWYNAWARTHGKLTTKSDALANFSYPPQGDIRSPPPGTGDDARGEGEVQVSQPAVRPRQHLRQLSLLERRAHKLPPLSSICRPGVGCDQPIAPVLPDIEPASPEPDNLVAPLPATINAKVLSWRQKTPTSVEAPKHEIHPLPATTVLAPPALDWDNFPWSTSSASPPARDHANVLLASRAQSVHIADRVAGSVGLTPTSATSFGARHSGLVSPVCSFASRRPSPDIAQRVMEDAPYSPVAATSWALPNNDSEYAPPSSPLLRAPDIGERMTSPTVGPHSKREVTLRAGSRRRAAGVDAENRILFSRAWPSQFGRQSAQKSCCSSVLSNQPPTTVIERHPVMSPMHYPDLIIYPPVYPPLEIYPAKIATIPNTVEKPANTFQDVDGTVIRGLGGSHPNVELCPPVYPHDAQMYPAVMHSKRAAVLDTEKNDSPKPLIPAYPYFQLYPPVYPHPALIQGKEDATPEPLASVHPTFEPYGSVHSHDLSSLYPGLATQPQAQVPELEELGFTSFSKYPFLVIYPDVYPSLVIYPPRAGLTMEDVVEDGESSPPSITPYPYISVDIPTPEDPSMWPLSPEPRVQNMAFMMEVFANNGLVLDYSPSPSPSPMPHLSPTPMPPLEDSQLLLHDDVAFETVPLARRVPVTRQRSSQMPWYLLDENFLILDDDTDLDDAFDAPWAIRTSSYSPDIPIHAALLEDELSREEPLETLAAVDSSKFSWRGTAALWPEAYVGALSLSVTPHSSVRDDYVGIP